MNKITNIDNNYNQSLNIILEDGTVVSMNIFYSINQQGWFYSLSYKDFACNNRRLVVSPNMLREFRNIISFGLACTSTDGYEPIYLNDFSSGRISLFSLSKEDVSSVENLITITIPANQNVFLN